MIDLKFNGKTCRTRKSLGRIWSNKQIGDLCVALDLDKMEISLESHDFGLSLKSGQGDINGVNFILTPIEDGLSIDLIHGDDHLQIHMRK